MDTMTREQAAEAGLKVYRAAKPCEKGHAPLRYTSNGHCTTCAKEGARERNRRVRSALAAARRAAREAVQGGDRG